MNEQPKGDQAQPTAPPTVRGEERGRQPNEAREVFDAYHNVTETVGGLSLRWRDNLIQGAFIGIVTLLSAGVGWLFWDGPGAFVGAIAGAFGSLMLSGIVLGVLGWLRLGNRRKK